MKAIRHHIYGRLFQNKTTAALLLHDAQPSTRSADSLFLRYAFVTVGREDHIFPAFILDDWGNEIKGMEVYNWVHQFGSQFPRGEIFGFDRSGAEVQLFVRELELYQKLPCYVFTATSQPVTEGVLLNALLLPAADATRPQQGKRPSTIKRPLRSARLQWWHVPATIASFDLAQLG